MILETQEPFYTVTLGNLVGAAGSIFGVIIAYLALSRTRRTELDTVLKSQTEQHAKNAGKLDSLLSFQEDQIALNQRRDVQVGELQRQTATLIELTKGFNRRLEMMEDRAFERRQRPRTG
jgi:hypothetical protein